MRKVALKVAYIGSNFSGFQRQADVPTVEGEIIKALQEIELIETPDASGFSIAGRTDKGVHAMGNVVAFRSENEIRINQINKALPSEVQFIAKAPVHFGFRPRYALRRYYRYIMVDFEGLDITKMQIASEYMVGTHNFLNFSKRSERNPIRTVESINISKNGQTIIVDVVGQSFLWKMVRKMIMVLYQCGKGEIDPERIPEYLNPHYSPGLKPMPSSGLILMDVEYKNLKFRYDKYAGDLFISTLKEEFEKTFNQAMVEQSLLQNMIELQEKK